MFSEIFDSPSKIQTTYALVAFAILCLGIICALVLKHSTSLSNTQKVLIFIVVIGSIFWGSFAYMLFNYSSEVLHIKKETIVEFTRDWFLPVKPNKEPDSATDVRKTTTVATKKQPVSETDILEHLPKTLTTSEYHRPQYRSAVFLYEGVPYLDPGSRVVILAKHINVEDGTAELDFSPSNAVTRSARFFPGGGLNFKSDKGDNYMLYLTQPEIVNSHKRVNLLILL